MKNFDSAADHYNVQTAAYIGLAAIIWAFLYGFLTVIIDYDLLIWGFAGSFLLPCYLIALGRDHQGYFHTKIFLLLMLFLLFAYGVRFLTRGYFLHSYYLRNEPQTEQILLNKVGSSGILGSLKYDIKNFNTSDDKGRFSRRSRTILHISPLDTNSNKDDSRVFFVFLIIDFLVANTVVIAGFKSFKFKKI